MISSSATRATRASPGKTPALRLTVKGKFLFLGDEKFYLKGVTYGTFSPNSNDELFPEPEVVAKDFALMRENGVNTVRTYTAPPNWLLDEALKYELRVMVGLPWEQHVAFLDEGLAGDIERRVREEVLRSAGHPAVLCYAVGNEIPAPMVRWHGKKRVETFLHRLYRAVKSVDAEALVTYVNYPTTEYLELPFLDFVAFNAYLETQKQLDAYLAKLQNIAGERPLVMAEVGLDSQRNGLGKQAEVMDWQVRSAFGAGCAGMFVFAWTDEWYRGGHEIEDWDFRVGDKGTRAETRSQNGSRCLQKRSVQPADRVAENLRRRVQLQRREDDSGYLGGAWKGSSTPTLKPSSWTTVPPTRRRRLRANTT